MQPVLLFVFLALQTASGINEDEEYRIRIVKKEIPKALISENGVIEQLISWKMKGRENFTKCDKFLENTALDIEKLLNVDWKAFYFWVDTYTEDIPKDSIINFRRAEPNLVKRFETILGKHLKHVNWSAAELVLNTNDVFNCLFFTTNQSGLFYIVWYHEQKEMGVNDIEFEQRLMDANSFLAIKFIEPHYIGMMNCNLRELIALAPFNKMPPEDEVESVAMQFNMRSSFGLSYLELNKTLGRPAKLLHQEKDDREVPVYADDDLSTDTLTIF